MNSSRILNVFFILGILLAPSLLFAVEQLNFGVYTSNKPTAMVKKFKPIMKAIEKHMSRNLGERVKIRIQVAKNYNQGISHLASGKVDFSRFGPASYVEAKESNDGLEILALESKGGSKTSYGVICVAKNSPINSVRDLKGKTFAFGDKQSTIGRFLSQQYLAKQGVHAENLSYFEYLGRHDKVGTAVGAGQFDAGALNESTFKKLIKKGEPIRAIARFSNVAKPWIARSGLPREIRRAIRQALFDMKDKKALKALKKDGFVPGSDEDYAIIRDAIDRNHEFFNPTHSQSAPSENPVRNAG